MILLALAAAAQVPQEVKFRDITRPSDTNAYGPGSANAYVASLPTIEFDYGKRFDALAKEAAFYGHMSQLCLLLAIFCAVMRPRSHE